MDGRKRMILGLSIALGAAIAAHLAAMAPCQGQTPPSDYGRASGSETIAPPAGRPNRVDPGVQRSHIHSRYPSSQQMPLPEAPAKPQPSYTPPAAPSNPPPPAPNYTPSYTPNYAPQYAPNYAPQYAPAYAPQYAMIVPMMPQYQAPPPAAPGNFFLPAPAPSAAPAYGPPMAPMMPAPAYGPPMAPMMPAPAYGPPMVPAAPQPAMMGTVPALAGSSVAVPTSSSSSSVEIRGPGLLSAGLARVGEHLVQLGRTRVRTVQQTVLQTPRSQPLGGMATIATSGVTSVQAPVAPSAPSAPSAPPGREEAPPMAPTPSPQGAQSHHGHSLLNHLLGHD